MKAPHGELNPVAMSEDINRLKTRPVDAIDSDSNAAEVWLILHNQAMKKPSSLTRLHPTGSTIARHVSALKCAAKMVITTCKATTKRVQLQRAQ